MIREQMLFVLQEHSTLQYSTVLYEYSRRFEVCNWPLAFIQ